MSTSSVAELRVEVEHRKHLCAILEIRLEVLNRQLKASEAREQSCGKCHLLPQLRESHDAAIKEAQYWQALHVEMLEQLRKLRASSRVGPARHPEAPGGI